MINSSSNKDPRWFKANIERMLEKLQAEFIAKGMQNKDLQCQWHTLQTILYGDAADALRKVKNVKLSSSHDSHAILLYI